MPHDPAAPQPRIRRIPTAGLRPDEIATIRALLVRAFGTDPEEAFTDDDWEHALGGVHFVVDVNSVIVAHAAVVEREIQIGDAPLRTGYVEAVATSPAHQGVGFGSLLMDAVNAWIKSDFELGVLGTGRQAFYERSGWLRWQGPSLVRVPGGAKRTPEDDAYLMVLGTPLSPPFDRASAISCDWRCGDVW